MATMTARDVINRAATRAHTRAGEEALTAAEMVDALSDLNLLMHSFQGKGISYAHTDLAASDTVNMPDQMLDNLVWLATEMLATGDYGLPIDPIPATRIGDARQALQAFYSVEQRAVIDHALRNRRFAGFNFTRGD